VTELGSDGKINTDAALIAAADQALYQAKPPGPQSYRIAGACA
jgi:PleD family two-component response regulator